VFGCSIVIIVTIIISTIKDLTLNIAVAKICTRKYSCFHLVCEPILHKQ